MKAPYLRKYILMYISLPQSSVPSVSNDAVYFPLFPFMFWTVPLGLWETCQNDRTSYKLVFRVQDTDLGFLRSPLYSVGKKNKLQQETSVMC